MYWVNLACLRLEVGQIFVLGGGFSNAERAVMVKDGTFQDISMLASTHEEADTRLLLHTVHASGTFGRIVIWSPDTDIAVLCVHFCSNICSDVWFRSAVKDKARYIPVNQIAVRLGHKL
ncbi:hypothetical protein HOLleu_24387 [Holothuria leucospilota]|uniref:Uncharacterized protein n=1 Tax=Holothuria leucospilota TaxID=206669 RepID=A0A9Q1BWN5_HOLLE|nr:hypothetical protein HOLleu_24387 [Holothuria leucospilota]